MYDFYIATRYRNKDDALLLAGALRERGYAVYCFAESAASTTHLGPVTASNPDQLMQTFEARGYDDPAIRDVFDTDLAAINTSRNVVLLLPAGNSAHIEAGIAYGLGKGLFLVGDAGKVDSLYLIFDARCATQEEFLQRVGTWVPSRRVEVSA